MKLLLDFFPILLFFGAFKVWGIYVATGVAIAASVLQIAWVRYSTGKVQPMQWLGLGVIVLFGGATLVSHNDTFIKWKPTALYWLMGGALLVGQLVFKRNFIRQMMGAQLQLPDHVWRTLNWAWTAFFVGMGLLNLWVAYTFDLDTWVSFKLFGGLGLMAAFVFGQVLWMGRYLKEDDAAAASPAAPADREAGR